MRASRALDSRWRSRWSLPGHGRGVTPPQCIQNCAQPECNSMNMKQFQCFRNVYWPYGQQKWYFGISLSTPICLFSVRTCERYHWIRAQPPCRDVHRLDQKPCQNGVLTFRLRVFSDAIVHWASILLAKRKFRRFTPTAWDEQPNHSKEHARPPAASKHTSPGQCLLASRPVHHTRFGPEVLNSLRFQGRSWPWPR